MKAPEKSKIFRDIRVERITSKLKISDLNDLCDAADSAILAGGGFGWVKMPERQAMERYWQGVNAVPNRILLVARLEGVIAGALQIIRPQLNNEAQRTSVQFAHHFTAPWARKSGIAKALLLEGEAIARDEGYEVINLDVRETMSAAIKLYEGQGYTLMGIHPAYAKVNDDMVKGHYYYKILN